MFEKVITDLAFKKERGSRARSWALFNCSTQAIVLCKGRPLPEEGLLEGLMCRVRTKNPQKPGHSRKERGPGMRQEELCMDPN